MHPRKWQKLKLIWIEAFELTITIDYGLFWFYIYIDSIAAPILRVRRAWNLTGTSVQNGQKFFILFGKKYYFIQKLKFSYKLKLYYFIQKLKFSYKLKLYYFIQKLKFSYNKL